MTDRIGPWIETYTGKQFYPLDPRPEDICIEDIAHALSNQCRYVGHVQRFYSVAEHSWLVAHVLPIQHRKWGLLHDATEAYIGDMSRPLKSVMPKFREIEDQIMLVIAWKFGLDGYVIPPEVHEIDTRICHDEKLMLMSQPGNVWDLPGKAVGVAPVGYQPKIAEAMFMEMFNTLFG